MPTNDLNTFKQHLARASVGQVPIADQVTHERIARETVAKHPGMAAAARATGNYLPLIREAEQADPGRIVSFWMAQRIGQLVRAEPTDV